jgi:hypothetical protein
MKLIPIYDATAPITCTATSDALRTRIEQIERLRAAMTRVERIPHGLLLHFPDRPSVDAEVRRFAVDEKGCCQFWGFAIDTVDDELTLRWEGPPDTAALMDRLHAFLGSDQPLTAADGLL